MAWHLVRLKLTLLVSGLRRGWQQLVGTLAGVIVGLPLATLGAALLVWVGGQPAGDVALHATLTSVLILWVVGPPLTFGLDETLDPRRLQLLPLSQRQLATGLLCASAVGIGPAVTAILLAGAVIGFAPAGPGAVVVLAAGIGHLALCLVTARLITTLLSGWLRSRKGQDLLVAVGAFSGLGLAAVFQIPGFIARGSRSVETLVEQFETTAAVLSLLPSSWAATVMIAAGDGRWLTAAGMLAALAALVALLAGAWVRLLERASQTAGGQRRARPDRPLFAGPAGLLPRNRAGAAAAREIRYLLGEPQLRVQWMITVVFAGALVGAGVLAPEGAPGTLVLAVAGLAGLQGLASVNAFGADRGAVWMLLSASQIEPSDLAGKNVAGAALVLPIVTVAALGLATATGGWANVLPAVLLAVAVLGVCYGVGDVASVLAPSPLPERPSNAWAGTTGTGCATALAQALAFMLVAVVMLPAAAGVLATIFLAPGWLIVAAFLAAAYGLAMWGLGVRFAGRLAANRGPEILSALEG